MSVFAAVAELPFAFAALAWILASIAAVGITAELLARSTGVPRASTWIVVGLPAAVVAIPIGQITPFVGLGIAICAYGLRFRRPCFAAFGALLTGLEPPVALAACSALFIAMPATRLWLLAGAGGLAVLSLATLGQGPNAEYFATVLREHALANVMERTQFSTTHFAWVAGLAKHDAVTLGSIWFAGSLVIGISIALKLRHVLGDAAIVLVPVAFAVFGGVHVHFQQLALALPAFLLLTVRPLQKRGWVCAAVFTLAVPWLQLAAFPVFVGAIFVLATVFCRSLDVSKLGARLGAICGVVLLTFSGAAFLTLHGRMVVRTPATISGNPLAEQGWANYVADRDFRPEPIVLFLQLPSVCAITGCLVALMQVGLVQTRRRPIARLSLPLAGEAKSSG